MKRKLLCALIILYWICPTFAASLSLSGFYSGKLASGEFVKLYLQQNNDKLYGYYGVDKNIKVSYIPNAKTLSGTIQMGNFVILKEASHNGETRIFEGFLDKDKVQLRGDWLFPNAEPVDLEPLKININDKLYFKTVRTEQIDHELHRAITVNAPELRSKEKLTDNQKKFVEYINNRIFKLKNSFTRDVLISDAKDNNYFFGNSSLNVDYEVTYAKYPLISMRFNVSTYYAGAVHALHSTMTVNYDLEEGRSIVLGTLFKKYSNYLQFASELAQQALENNLQKYFQTAAFEKYQYWIAHGTDPLPENFRNWNFTELGILFSFEPYQVAPFALGRQEIIIPYELISEAFQPAVIAALKGPQKDKADVMTVESKTQPKPEAVAESAKPVKLELATAEPIKPKVTIVKIKSQPKSVKPNVLTVKIKPQFKPIAKNTAKLTQSIVKNHKKAKI